MDRAILRPDVLIVGSGPIGGALAIGLKKEGYSILVVEKQAKVQKVFKGEYVQPAGTQVLRRLGLTRIFEQPSYQAIRELRFRDLNQDGSVSSETLMSYPSGFSATAISHHDLVSSIREEVREQLGANAHFGTEVTPMNENESDFFESPRFLMKMVNGEETVVTPKWVIGCDSRASTVRKWMGGQRLPQNRPVTLGSPSEMIVGAEIPNAPPMTHRYEVFRCAEMGTLSSFSLGELGQRLYLSHINASPAGLKACRALIRDLLAKTREHCDLGQIEDSSAILSFPAYGMWFGPVHRGAFLLAGDAACVTSPYGGQGISAGLEHVEYLLDTFDFKANLGEPTMQMARNYAEQVRKSHSRISLLNFGLYYLFFARGPVFRKISAHVLKGWERNPEMKDRVARLFAGLDRDTPAIGELLELWGISPTAGWRRSLSPRLLSMRAIGALWETHN